MRASRILVRAEGFMLFLVKVRIDVGKMGELGKKLAGGGLDMSAIRSTHCYAFDPEVGVSVWEADSPEDFRRRFAPHRAYYRDVMEVTPVIAPQDAQKALVASMP
jgi:hypothetical protein